MRKIIFNKKFLAVVGICLSVAGGFAIKQKITTKAADQSFAKENPRRSWKKI